jgi:DNA-binding beta-propeller fold protein YncE
LENQALPIVSNLSAPAGMTIDDSGNLYVTERGGNTIRKISPSGTKTILAGSGFSGLQNGSANQAKFNAPDGICFRNGALIVADTGNHCLREIQFTPASASASGDAQIQIVFGNSLSVSVSASAGGTFVIESTSAIAPGAQWQTEGTVAAGTGPALNISKPTSTRFYRARKP